MREGINVILRYDRVWNGVALWIVEQRGNEQAVAKAIDLIFEPKLPYEEVEPTMRFCGHAASYFLQDLANGIVEAGYAPDIVKTQKGEIGRIEAHLEDMRTLVFEGGVTESSSKEV